MLSCGQSNLGFIPNFKTVSLFDTIFFPTCFICSNRANSSSLTYKDTAVINFLKHQRSLESKLLRADEVSKKSNRNQLHAHFSQHSTAITF